MVAAPIRKLWPEKLAALTPACERAFRKCEISWALFSGVPSWNINNGPGVDGRIDRYANTTTTGHRVAITGLSQVNVAPCTKLVDFTPTKENSYRVYSNRTQAKKIITILTFARFSGKGRQSLH